MEYWIDAKGNIQPEPGYMKELSVKETSTKYVADPFAKQADFYWCRYNPDGSLTIGINKRITYPELEQLRKEMDDFLDLVRSEEGIITCDLKEVDI